MGSKNSEKRSSDWAQFGEPHAFSEPEQLLAAYFSSATVGLAICDRKLRFQAINLALAGMNGLPAKAHLGKTVRAVLGNAAKEVEPAMRQVLATGQPVLNLELAFLLPTRTEVGHWIENYFPVKDSAGRVRQVGIVVIEVTKQKQLEQSLHHLTGKLLRIKDEEQQRIARELHDSLNQYHAAIKMNLRLLNRCDCPPRKATLLLIQSLELVDACIAETRTISHLLHPPSLDKLGFASAAQWFVKGFAQRSGIRVNLRLAHDLGRLPPNVEIALFRVLQESLTNVHRHAQAKEAEIWVFRKATDVIFKIRDHGRGMRASQLQQLRATGTAGVGVASMRERIHELQGSLEIRSCRRGTELKVTIPVPVEAVGAEKNSRLVRRAAAGAANS
jgi:signal transduction histidine kinase